MKTLLVGASFLCGAMMGFAQDYQPLFGATAEGTPMLRRPAVAAKRQRAVSIDYKLIDKSAAARLHVSTEKAPRLLVSMNLFNDTVYKVRFDQASYNGSTLVWSGTVEGDPGGQVVLAVTDKVVSGTLAARDGRTFRIANARGAVHWIEELDHAALPPDGQPIPVYLPPDTRRVPQADDGSLIDVLVVYTPALRQALGGLTQMQNRIALGIAETNQGYSNSNVIQRVRLVHAAEINYAETGSLETDLERLTNPSDGFMDNVHALRNQYGADMVSLWVLSGDYCGLGWLMTSASPAFESRAFSVVRGDCATGHYSFAHEMGHNQGSQHNVENAKGPGVFRYSYGYQQAAVTPYFRTIMAYPCATVNCQRLNYWSNPDQRYQGIATGTAIANNARSLNQTRATAANWRQSVVATTSISPVSANFSAAGGLGSVSVTATGAWTATSNANWITVTSGAAGTGNGTVSYTVAANPSSSSRTGSITIAGLVFSVIQAGAAGCLVTPAALNQPISGSWGGGDCQSPLRAGAFADRYSFAASSGQQVAIHLASANADAYLYLIGPGGEVIAQDDDSGGGASGQDARIPASGLFTLPASGAYVIEATTWGAGVSGSYTLTIQSPATCTYSLSPTAASVDSNQNTGVIQVSASAGCAWTATVNVPWIQITSNASGAGNGSVNYLVLANTSNVQRTGLITIGGQVFSITQSAALAGCAAAPIAVGQTVSGSLSASDCPSTRRSASHFADRYTFQGTAGQQVRIALDSAGLDPYLYLVGPSGVVFAEDDDSGAGLNSLIPATGFLFLPATGTYTVEVTSFNAGATGTYSLQLTSGPNCALTPLSLGQFANGILTTADCFSPAGPFYADFYSFTALAGQQIALTMTGSLDTYLTLYGPDGRIIAEDDDSAGNFNSRIPPSGNLTLPETGTYVIETSTFFEFDTGAYTLQLSGTPTACSFTVTLSGSSARASGGTVLGTVTTQADCSWVASSLASWITITAGAGGTGSGNFSFAVAPNSGTSARNGRILVGGQTVHILQKAFAPVQLFQDVPLAHLFADYIGLLRENNVTQGCSAVPPLYCPDQTTTRGQMAVFIIRSLFKSDTFPYPATPYFSDVPSGHPFFRYIQKMRELNITSGCTPTTYCPDAPISRGQMAVFLVRAALALTPGQLFPYHPSPYFTDVAAQDPFFPFIQKLRELGITSGCSASAYCPGDPVTRGQMAVFLIRSFYSDAAADKPPRRRSFAAGDMAVKTAGR